MAPVSPPPWPGSRMTVGVVIGEPAVSVVLLPQGVSTSQPRGSLLSTGSANPWGDMIAFAGGTVAGGGGAVVGAVVVGGAVVAGNVPTARSSGR